LQCCWIPGLAQGRVAILGRPRAGDWLVDDIRGWVAAGVTDVVSLLEDHETRELGLIAEAASALEAAFPTRTSPHAIGVFRRDGRWLWHAGHVLPRRSMQDVGWACIAVRVSAARG
jgi:hypothetical protein